MCHSALSGASQMSVTGGMRLNLTLRGVYAARDVRGVFTDTQDSLIAGLSATTLASVVHA